MSDLHIADGIGEDREPLSLPSEVVTQAIGILARRGAGKTHTATVLVEEVVRAGLPVVILDPTGAWWGLRSSADGNAPGLPVIILGGEHGDVPLERTAGKVIADLVIDHPGAFVLDLSGFESRAAEQTFAADFLERLYRGKATKRDALLVVVDEADNFAPQRPGPEQTRTLGALEAIIRRGRIRGLGAVLISQRAAVINKNVLTQIEVLIALQTTGPQDIAAVKEWVLGHAEKDEAETFAKSLAGLGRGEAWVWSPSWLRILRKVQIRQRRTFDSSKTPEAGAVAVEPRAFATVDLESLGKQIAATVEQVKANDPAALRRRIAELERQVGEKPEPVIERVEVPVLNGQVKELEAILSGFVPASGQLADSASAIATVVDDMRRIADSILSAVGTVQRAPVAVAPRPVAVRPAPLPRPAVERAARSETDRALSKAERLILATLAQYPQGRTKTQVALLTGYAHSGGGFNNAISALRSSGMVEGGKDRLAITDDGMAAIGNDWTPLPTGRALLEHWMTQLSKAERAILAALADAYPNAMTKEEVGSATGYEPAGGGFNNALSRLRTLELIERGTPRMSDDLA